MTRQFENNPYSAPRTQPDNKPRRPFKAYLGALWARIFNFFVTFAVLTGSELVTVLIFFPDFVFDAEAEFWREALLVANLVVALPAGAWAATARLQDAAAKDAATAAAATSSQSPKDR
jgi:hypothetical protein